MKLLFVIVQNDDSKLLIRELNKRRIRVTRIASTGGFLHGGNSTLMIGIENERLEETLDIIKQKSSVRKEYMVVPSAAPGGFMDSSPAPIQVTMGGATVFVLDAEQAYKF
ncbi:MAG: cyclic-di-AMP receptor [bacterium]|nr:cyclic-di-AMP receptor [bacterium]